LPAARHAAAWDSIITPEGIKSRLLNQAILSLQLRTKLDYSVTALHGLVLLYGPPGTGKTTLARGLANEVAKIIGRARLIAVNPHGLMSAEHGQSQQRVIELMTDRIPALADDGTPTFVLLDEVESMAVARSAASLSANPADVHRATDAVLTALDELGRSQPHIITIATSNFSEALDEAFKSRADLALEVPLPTAEGVAAILRRTLDDFGEAFPRLRVLAKAAELDRVAAALVGLDGRRVRKSVTEALASRREVAMDPGKLTIADLLQVAQQLRTVSGKQGIHAAA
jgi:AAA+ superfamily predicted ATPase